MTRRQTSSRTPSRSFRPDPAEDAAAVGALGARPMEEFLRACLRALAADPAGFLAVLEPHWPAPRRRGRPAKQDDDEGAQPSSGK